MKRTQNLIHSTQWAHLLLRRSPSVFQQAVPRSDSSMKIKCHMSRLRQQGSDKIKVMLCFCKNISKSQVSMQPLQDSIMPKRISKWLKFLGQDLTNVSRQLKASERMSLIMMTMIEVFACHKIKLLQFSKIKPEEMITSAIWPQSTKNPKMSLPPNTLRKTGHS